MSANSNLRTRRSAELRSIAISMRGIANNPELSPKSLREHGNDCLITAVRVVLDVAAIGLFPGSSRPMVRLINESTAPGELPERDCLPYWRFTIEPWFRREFLSGEVDNPGLHEDSGFTRPDHAYAINARRMLHADADVLEAFAGAVEAEPIKPAYLGITLDQQAKTITRNGVKSRPMTPKAWEIFLICFQAAGQRVARSVFKETYSGDIDNRSSIVSGEVNKALRPLKLTIHRFALCELAPTEAARTPKPRPKTLRKNKVRARVNRKV